MNAFEIASAGGVALDGPQPDPRLDTVLARRYRHPALGDRAVVRLVPETLATAEDLTLEFHGFAAPASSRPVGRQLRKGLGFPGWAMVHDPARAGLALEIVKDLRACARQARSRPGAAKESLDALGERLGRSVPHFLPSFYEEAGRIFLDQSNPGMATQMFGKARLAEKVHALKVDESLRRESFLEFALAGAVSVKALSDYGKDLASEHEPMEAYQHFRELCLRRTLGGMPPWATMLKDLNRLAKGAKIDIRAEERAFLEEVLGSASVKRAPVEFWVTASGTVVDLVRQSETIAETLTMLLPEFSGDKTRHGEAWLGLLDKWGLVARLEQHADAAGWVSRMMGHFYSWQSGQSCPDALFAVARRLAPRLRQQTVVVRDDWRGVDLDFLELLASLEVPLDLSKIARYSLNLRQWAQGKGAERPKDPVHLVRLPAAMAILMTSLDNHAGQQPFEGVSARLPGWQQARRLWLERQVQQLEQGAVPTLRFLVERWERLANPSLFGPYPDLRERLSKLRLEPILARSLRGFVAEELGWAGLDEAVAELNPDGKAELAFDGFFPVLVVRTSARAVAVGPEGIVARQDVVLPAGARLESVTYLGGQFLTRYLENHARVGRWSGGQSCDLSAFYSPALGFSCATLPGIGLTYGGQAVNPGEAQMASRSQAFFCDGETCWTSDWVGNEMRAREYDPRTGKAGRLSMPRFLEDFAEPGWRVDLMTSRLYPLPGERGLAGWRVRRSPDGTVEGETVDGRRYAGKWEGRGTPQGMVSVPGSHCLVATLGNQRSVNRLEDGQPLATAADSPGALLFSLPPHWWPLFDVRDPADSLALRQVKDEAVLPTLRNSRLKAGVERMVQAARGFRERLAAFATEGAPESGASERVLARQIPDALRSLGLTLAEGHDLTLEVEAVTALVSVESPSSAPGLFQKLAGFFGARPAAPPVPAASSGPMTSPALLADAAGCLGALAWRCVAPLTPEEERSPMLTLLSQLAASPLVQQGAHFRRLVLQWERPEPILRLATAHNAYLLDRRYSGNYSYHGLEYSADGTFRPPAESTVASARPCAPAWETPQRLQAFVSAASRLGARSWNRAHPDRLAQSTGLTYAEACLLWIGLTRIHSYEANFLPGEVRERMELKAADARLAKDNLRALSAEQRFRLYSEAMPEDPERLWTDPEGCVDLLAAAWNRMMGTRLSVPEELLKELSDLVVPLKPAVVLGLLGRPDEGPLARDGKWQVAEGGRLRSFGDVFSEDHFTTLFGYLATLAESAPVGDPLRQSLARVWGLVLQRLRNPDLLFLAGRSFGAEEAQKQSWVRALGGQDNGRILLHDDRWCLLFFYRPARFLADCEDRLLESVASLPSWSAFKTMCTPEHAALVERVGHTPVPAGQFETNPLVSAPELVEAAMARFGLSREAAVLYLQSLALLRPTTKNVTLWNGWTPAVYKAACEELTRSKLMLEAKRSRAGRTHFLPGGWRELKAPNLPVEIWKLPLYGVVAEATSFPFGRILPLRPVHQTFALAWRKVEAGQGPAYE